jgi:acid phosphatase (class A)
MRMRKERNRLNRDGQRGFVARANVLFLALCVAVPLWAGEPYLAPHQPDGIALLPPPPALGSAEQAADLASARAVFLARTPAEETRAKHDAGLSLFDFAPAIGAEFRPGRFPKLEILFQKVRTNISETIDYPKNHWKRPRPYEQDKELLLGPPENSVSYPSGHSTRGMVVSLLLAELFPERKGEILEFGRTIGWDRIVLGKHYPTDVFAGRVLGKAIVRELMASGEFQQDFAEVIAEIKAARIASPEPSAPAAEK